MLCYLQALVIAVSYGVIRKQEMEAKRRKEEEERRKQDEIDRKNAVSISRRYQLARSFF